MSLFEAFGGAPLLANPQSPPPQPTPLNPGQIDYPVLQLSEELRRDEHLSETPEGGNLPFAVQYQLLMSDTFNIDYNPQVVDSSSTNYQTPFLDTAYSYHTNNLYSAPGIFPLTNDYTASSARRNDATFASSGFETGPAYLSTTTFDFTYEATNFSDYASTSATSYTAAHPSTNQGHFQQPQTSASSFASRWGGYQDLERDNDPIVLDEISKEHKSITRQRERNRKTFRKQLREKALGPKPRGHQLSLHLAEDFGCLFPVDLDNAHKKPYIDLKYPRDKTKDNEIENRHIHYPNGVDYEDWGDLEPGRIYKVARAAEPTPETILNSTWSQHEDLVVYLPRPFEYSDGPTFTVLCSYKGVPGVNVFTLAKDRLNAKDLDGYEGSWMDNNWYRYTNYHLAIQWPGYPKKMFKFNNAKVNISNGYRYTILHAVAKFLWKYMMDAKNGKMPYVRTARTEVWQLKKRSHMASKVRLMAVNYYRHVFFPVIAIEVSKGIVDPIEEDYLPVVVDEE